MNNYATSQVGNGFQRKGRTTAYIHRWQPFEILLYGIDAWREAALDDGVQIIRGGCYTDVVVYLPAERIDFIATHLDKIAIRFSAVFGSSQYRIVSELIMLGEVGLYLRVLGGSLSWSGCAVPSLWFSFICITFHYMPVFVSMSEVRKRTGKFQAFGECLHNVAYIGYEILMIFYRGGTRKG